MILVRTLFCILKQLINVNVSKEEKETTKDTHDPVFSSGQNQEQKICIRVKFGDDILS